MRIEELKSGNYIKTPDKAEKEILNVVNRFFNSDMEDFDKSKEAIIVEVQRRLKPLIINLVKRIAWEQGKDIFEPMIEELVDKVIKEEIGSIKDLIDEIKNNVIRYKEYSYVIDNTTTSVIVLPPDSEIVAGSGALKVNVNGIKQLETSNYTITLRDRFIESIVFFEALEENDVVDIEVWTYSNDTTGGTP